jgi:ATP-dependent protease HslVU (ClpYQ) peptidase subunit
MTTIIGIQEHDSAVLYADYQVSTESESFVSKTARKICRNWQLAYGTAGSGRLCDYIQYEWEPPQPDIDRDSDEEWAYNWLIRTFVPDMKKALRAEGYELGADGVDFQMIIIVRGFLFQIESDGTVMNRMHGLYGIGTGGAYALGALITGADPLQAMRAAETLDPFTASFNYAFDQVSVDKQ